MADSKEWYFFNPNPAQRVELDFLFTGAERAVAIARSSDRRAFDSKTILLMMLECKAEFNPWLQKLGQSTAMEILKSAVSWILENPSANLLKIQFGSTPKIGHKGVEITSLRGLGLLKIHNHDDLPSCSDKPIAQPTVLIKSSDGYFIELLIHPSASSMSRNKPQRTKGKVTVHLKQESKSDAGLKKSHQGQEVSYIQQSASLCTRDENRPVKVSVVLESKKGSRVMGTHICKECGTPTQSGFMYSRSNLGSIVLCPRCKPTVFNRSFGNIDALDHALTGGRFEGNRSKH